MLVIGPIAPLGLFQDIEAALMGVVSFYKQHYFLLQYWCCISFLPPSLLAQWHSVQLDFCLIWQKRTCEEIKCRVNFHWSHFQKHQISQKLWEGTMRSALEEKDLSSSKLCSLYFWNINIGIMLTPLYRFSEHQHTS